MENIACILFFGLQPIWLPAGGQGSRGGPHAAKQPLFLEAALNGAAVSCAAARLHRDRSQSAGRTRSLTSSIFSQYRLGIWVILQRGFSRPSMAIVL